MGEIFRKVREALAEDGYVFTRHATHRLRRRHIPAWQAVALTLEGTLLRERPNDEPFPVAEVEIRLADGTKAKCVWSWSEHDGMARLVTVHYFQW